MSDSPNARINLDRVTHIPVRVSAEIGRSTQSLQTAVSLRPGEVLDLEQSPSDPVEIYVDGVLYAVGELAVVDGNWAVKLVEIMVESKPELFEEEPAEEETAEEEPVEPEAETEESPEEA